MYETLVDLSEQSKQSSARLGLTKVNQFNTEKVNECKKKKESRTWIQNYNFCKKNRDLKGWLTVFL